jgi:hypothetical protein
MFAWGDVSFINTLALSPGLQHNGDIKHARSMADMQGRVMLCDPVGFGVAL